MCFELKPAKHVPDRRPARLLAAQPGVFVFILLQGPIVLPDVCLIAA